MLQCVQASAHSYVTLLIAQRGAELPQLVLSALR